MFSHIHCATCRVNKMTPLTNSPKITLRRLQSLCEVFLYRQKCTAAPIPRSNPVIMKLNSPEFYSIFTPELKKLDSIFSKYGYELRIVGGAVRDLLVGKKPSDLDFATTATPDQMKEMFTVENIRMLSKRGEKHGTVTPRIDDRTNFEITTLRTDLYCDGRHAKVLFITDWVKDAARRDLTINSMYLGLDGSVYDYFNGYEDLKKKRVIFVGNAEMRIEEDFLRILRYFRFFGRIAEDPHSHDEHTLKVIKQKGYGLEKISGERIWSELHRILSGNFKKELLKTMMECELTQYIGLGQPDQLDKSCFDTTCERDLKHNLKPITIVSSLLIDEDKVLKFHSRLRLSSYERDLALFIVYHKNDNSSISAAEKLESLKYLLACTQLDKKQMREYIIELLKFKDEELLMSAFEAWELPAFPITGKIIQLRYQINDRKAIYNLLTKLKHSWIQSNYQLKTDDLMKELAVLVANTKFKKIFNKEKVN